MRSSVRKTLFLSGGVILILFVVAIVVWMRWPCSGRTIRIHGGRADVVDDGKVVWTTPKAWIVHDARIGDMDDDGVKDIIALVDAPGTYGRLKPFWITEDDQSLHQHLYIFDIVDGAFHPVWMTSRIYTPTCSFLLQRNVDGSSDLVTWDGDDTAKNGVCASPKRSVWHWNGWGFSKVSGDAP